MNLAETLDGYAADALNAMLRVWDLDTAKRAGTKTERIRLLTAILSDAERLGDARLTPGERIMLALAGRHPDLRTGTLLRAFRARGEADAESTLTGLVGRGLVLCLDAEWGSKIALNDVMRRTGARLAVAPGLPELLPLSTPAPICPAPVPDVGIRAVRPHRGAETGARILALVACAARRKLRVNVGGDLGNPALEALVRDLELPPMHVVWLLELARAGGLVDMRDRLLRPVELPADARTLGGLLARVHAGFVARSTLTDDIDLDAPTSGYRVITESGASAARGVLHGVLARLGTDGWVRVDDLVDAALRIDRRLGLGELERYRYSTAGDCPSDWLAQREYARGALTQAAWRLGLVDVGTTEAEWHTPLHPERPYDYDDLFREGGGRRSGAPALPAWTPPPCGLCVRLTPLGRRVLGLTADEPATGAIPGFLVAMDFEVVGPVATTPPGLTFRLDQAARPLPIGPGDPVRRWKLERERWLAALQGGLDGAALLADLAEALGRPLPGNVADTLAGWANNYGVTTLFAGHDLIAYADRAARDAAARGPRTVAIADRWLLVPRGGVNGTVLHYGGPPIRSLEILEDATVKVLVTADLLVPSELDPITEGAGATRRLSAAKLRGRPAEPLLDALRARAATPMSATTEVLIRGWCGDIPPAGLAAVELLQLEDATTAEALAARPELAPYVQGALYGGVLVLRPNCRPAVVQALGSLGIGVANALEYAPK